MGGSSRVLLLSRLTAEAIDAGVLKEPGEKAVGCFVIETQ